MGGSRNTGTDEKTMVGGDQILKIKKTKGEPKKKKEKKRSWLDDEKR